MDNHKLFKHIMFWILTLIALLVIVSWREQIAYKKGQDEKICSCEFKDLCYQFEQVKEGNGFVEFSCKVKTKLK